MREKICAGRRAAADGGKGGRRGQDCARESGVCAGADGKRAGVFMNGAGVSMNGAAVEKRTRGAPAACGQGLQLPSRSGASSCGSAVAAAER